MKNKEDKQATPSINPFNIPPQAVPKVIMPGNQIPSFNVSQAFDRGVAGNFLINTWGGLGDQICAEPAIRFALKIFNKTKISLASRCPSLYSHLEFEKVFDTRKENPTWEDYLVFQTILPPSSLLWEFCSHMLTHAVDFSSICMWRCMLPIADREIKTPDFYLPTFKYNKENFPNPENTIVVHAGKHWPSKTFPKHWWNKVISQFLLKGFKVILIGQKVDENVGYVDVDPEGCEDLRDQLSIPEFLTLLKNCHYLFSNDSSPIHAASAGDAFIGVVASCKHPDFILHWRHGEFMWNAKNFGLDGMWNHTDFNPAQESEVKAEFLPDGLIEALLPIPKVVAEYYANLRDSKNPTI